ncbi:MAG: BrnT family toxin [Candidatus Promineofilum sp.]|nr:BrnT family toxin [Promineifilum sp.]
MEYEWDTNKAAADLHKHGVSFDKAATVLSDPLSITVPDPGHSSEEDRYITVGLSANQRLLIVAHTERDLSIRLISARELTATDRSAYVHGNF